MRISGGRAKGILLEVPRSGAVRPATDALRQAVFSSLGVRVTGARFLDLFAGSGSYGLEALSRGAAGGVFVEADPGTAACLRRNLAAVGRSLGLDDPACAVIPGEVLAVLKGAAVPPETDLVFVDPPYERIAQIAAALFSALGALLTAERDPLVVLEMPGDLELSPCGWDGFKRLGRPRGGQPTAAFFRRTDAR
ncbi:MAG: RsmD family RNA methyltransferase [Opitutaceae bacterium]